MNKKPGRVLKKRIYRGGMATLSMLANKNYVPDSEKAEMKAAAAKEGQFVAVHPEPAAPAPDEFATDKFKEAEQKMRSRLAADKSGFAVEQFAGLNEQQLRQQALSGLDNIVDYNDTMDEDNANSESAVPVPEGDAPIARPFFSGTCRLCSRREADCMLSTGQPICRNCARDWLKRDTSCPWTQQEIEFCHELE